jgi:hypothetical protein
VLGRSDQDASGRALLARQQSGLIELANLYGGLEDWELRIYRQCWARAKQFWTAPQFIRVTDDEDAPKFVGLNQPIPGGPPTIGTDPATGMPALTPGILGYKNRVAEMDVDIEVETQQDTGNIASEQFSDILNLVKLSPVYQQQAPLSMLIQLSTIPHKRAVLDQIKQAAAEQQAKTARQQAMAAQHAQAQIAKTQSEAQRNAAQGTASMLNALSEAHAVHAEHAAAGFEAGLSQANSDQAQAQTQAQMQQQAASGGQPGPGPGP